MLLFKTLAGELCRSPLQKEVGPGRVSVDLLTTLKVCPIDDVQKPGAL